MNYKKLAALTALTLTLVLGLMLFSNNKASAAATQRYVANGGLDVGDCSVMASPCETINYAISQSVAGDTINVAAGLYNEQVSINKTLTLKGAKAGVDARTRAAVGESIIDHACGPVQFRADNAVLDGFTVQGSTTSDPCFLSGIWTNPGASGTQGGHQILNNIVQNNISGIELDNTGTFQTKVQFNLIQNNNNPGPGSGSGIQVNFGLNNALIDNNKFSGHTNSSLLVSSGGNDQQITVSNNELVGGTFERIIFGSVDNSSITGNTIIGTTSSGAIRLFGGNNGITITCNLLYANQRGIRVDDPYAIGPNSNITANNNNIQGNAIAGLQVDSGGYFGGSLDATNNWWGSPTGPTHPSNLGGTGDKIIDPDGAVTFIPFLTSPSSCAPIPDFCPADPNKTDPGICGCGVPDTDTDGDGTPDCNDSCPTDPNKVVAGACGCGFAETPGCTTTEKDCKKFLHEQKKNFEDQQHADKKAFEAQQKAAKAAFDATNPTKAQRKAFDAQQKADKKAFDDDQKADKDAFAAQQDAAKEQCKTLPKGDGGDDDDDDDDDEE